MKKYFVLFGLATALRSVYGGGASVAPANPFESGLEEIVTVPLPASVTSPTRSFARLPLSFVRNDGQTDAQTKFEVHGPGYLLSLEQTGIEMVLPATDREHAERLGVRRPSAAFDAPLDDEQRAPVASHQPADWNGFEIPAHSPKAPEDRRTPKPDGSATPEWHSLRMKLVGAQTNAAITGEEELSGKFNYFLGNDPALWRTNVPSFAKVRYREVYPGIDLVFYGDEGQLEYDFVLAPGANANQIQFAIEGADRLEIDREGNLRLTVLNQELRWRKPTIYQESAGVRVSVAGQYVLGPAVACNSNTTVREVAFHIASYDQKLALVIDPVLVYGTFLGASDGATYGTSIATGPEGCVYVAGRTTSSSFPTQGALMPTNSGGGWSFYLTKLDATGQFVYSTYIGPIGDTPMIPKIAVDQSGSVYMAGNSSSRTFPVVNAVQPVFGGGTQSGDAFVMKLVPDGSALVYSTYLGGSGNDGATGIAVDSMGAAYVTGSTTSSNFPRTNAFQTTYRGSGDAFVAKLNPAGTALVYSTYFGGSGGDTPWGVAVDSEGNCVIAGATASTNLPTQSPFQEHFGGSYGDGFWAKFSPRGDTILSASYFGGTLNEYIRGIAVGSDGDIYLTGTTLSDDFPIANAIQPQNYAVGGPPPFDTTITAFLARYSTASNSLVFSTYLGGSVRDEAISVALDAMDNVYVAGVTLSPDFPTTDSALQGWNNGGSALYGVGFENFLSVLASDGSKLLYSSYLGGTGNEDSPYVAVDRGGNVYLTGSTTSADFPIAQPLIPYAGPTSAFVVRFSPLVPMPPSLQIMRSGSQVMISWPTSAAGFRLESSDALFPVTNWALEPTPPAVVGDQNVVTLELSAGARFFRLSKL